jgi:FSR family fosmidomycin resistance protein-like MFS transporter
MPIENALAEGAQPSAGGRLALMAWAHFLNDGYVNYVPGVLPVLLVALKIPVALAGSLVLMLQLAQLFQPVAGWWADKLGGRRFVLAGLAMSMAGASLVGLVPNYWSLLAVLLVAGMGSTIFHPPAMASARLLARRRHGLVMSVFLVGGELGRGLWPTLAGFLVVWLGLKGLWWIALPGVVSLALLWRYAPEMAPMKRKAAPTAAFLRGSVASLVSFVCLRNMLALGVATFVPILWSQRGGSLVGGASLVTVMLSVGIVGNLLGGALADRIGRRVVLVGSTVLCALFMVWFLLSSGPWLWVSLACLGIAAFTVAPITVLIGQDLFPDNRSTGSGVALGVGNALGAFGVFLLGFAAARYGINVPFWIMTGLTVICLVPAWRLPERA